MHTDPSLDLFDAVTIATGAKFRGFTNKTCPAFDTYELNRETNARRRRQAQKTSKVSDAASSRDNSARFGATNTSSADAGNTGRRRKTFNTQTYKYHSLGDYPNTIRRLGTTDSYSTEPVSSVQ